jgi:hypothetical protein
VTNRSLSVTDLAVQFSRSEFLKMTQRFARGDHWLASGG